ncbi:MAG: ABC transporter ATP-binding protein [Candidatus Paceibacterota bacterium]|jgi:ABC-type multidrug transport system fused ATPase/permease subunit
MNNKEKNYSSLDLIRSLWSFLRPYRGKFILGTLLRIIGEITWLYPAYALGSIATFFVGYHIGDPLGPFWQIIGLLGIASLVYFITSYFGNLLGFRTALRTSIDSQLIAIKHILKLDIGWHETENTGNKVKKIDRGSNAVNMLLRAWFSPMIGIVVSLVGVTLIISRFDKMISFLTLVFLVAYFLVSFFFTKNAVKVQRAENIKDENLSGLIFESVNNVRSAKVMSMIPPLTEMIRGMSSELYSLARMRVFWYQSGGAVKNLTGQAFRLAIMAYIGWGIMQGWYGVGFMVLFYSYFSSVQSAVGQLAESSQDFAIRKTQVGRMTDLLKEKPSTDIEDGKLRFPDGWKMIEVKNVSFAYGDKKILDNVTFTISRGEKIGIVGLSGAGKSTLFKLLLKERENYEGEILVDGIPLRSISKNDYFRHAAVVLQETEVFNFTLRDNVTISNHEKALDDRLFERAIEIAHVAEFAKALPQGTNTQIGEKGVKLSGGEKQRVGVARAIFKEPELLLLDEATSHLDIESEEKIQDSLHQFFQNVTAVVIAHRLTTIREMDKILVIEGGKIIEQGSFAELQASKGRFYGLWEKQKL